MALYTVYIYNSNDVSSLTLPPPGSVCVCVSFHFNDVFFSLFYFPIFCASCVRGRDPPFIFSFALTGKRKKNCEILKVWFLILPTDFEFFLKKGSSLFRININYMSNKKSKENLKKNVLSSMEEGFWLVCYYVLSRWNTPPRDLRDFCKRMVENK